MVERRLDGDIDFAKTLVTTSQGFQKTIQQANPREGLENERFNNLVMAKIQYELKEDLDSTKKKLEDTIKLAENVKDSEFCISVCVLLSKIEKTLGNKDAAHLWKEKGFDYFEKMKSLKQIKSVPRELAELE